MGGIVKARHAVIPRSVNMHGAIGWLAIVGELRRNMRCLDMGGGYL